MPAASPARLLTLSAPPFLRHPESVRSVMGCVAGALLPAVGAGVYMFGPRVLLVVLTCAAAAVATEWLSTLLMRRPASITDLSALVSGVLLACTLPPAVPLWMAAIGAVFAVGVAKMAFGGLGNNFINPALAGRAFLTACYPSDMSAFTPPLHGTIHGLPPDTMASLTFSLADRAGGLADAISSATPLTACRLARQAGAFQAMDFQEAIPSLFYGTVGGCIGATSAAALLVGAAFLWYKGYVSLRIPFAFVGTLFVLAWLFNGTGTLLSSEALTVPVFEVLAGGLLLGALFMATDTVTSPITPMGQTIFGAGCGLITFAIRRYGGYPEGVAYAILMMNCVAPLLDRWARPRPTARAAGHA